MAYRAACELGDVFAAVATVAGAIPASTSCRSPRPVPLLALHGRDDRVVPLGGRGGSQPLVAAADWSASWAAHNGCAPDASVSTATPGVQTRAWPACPAGADVVLTTIDGLGHAWPGDPTDRRSAAPIDASATIWAFFAAHPMAAGR
jgi:polyhydroxybutyrate depolymerase